MVESTDITLIATIAQTVVITLTLLVFIFQFRSQEKAVKESAYQGLMGRYNNFLMAQAESPEMTELVSQRISAINQQKPSPQEMSGYSRLLIAYELIQEAYALHKKGWIDDATWGQWAEWLKVLCKMPQLRMIYQMGGGMYDKEYEEFVGGVLRGTDSTTPDSRP